MHRSILIQLRLLSVRHREWERLKLTARSKCVRERKMRDAAGEKQHATTLRRYDECRHGPSFMGQVPRCQRANSELQQLQRLQRLQSANFGRFRRFLLQRGSPAKLGTQLGTWTGSKALTVQRLADLNFSTASALPQSMHPLQRRLAHKNVFANEQHPQWLAMHIRWSHQWHAGSFLKGEWTQSMQSATNLEAVNRFLPRHPQKPQTKGNC